MWESEKVTGTPRFRPKTERKRSCQPVSLKIGLFRGLRKASYRAGGFRVRQEGQDPLRVGARHVHADVPDPLPIPLQAPLEALQRVRAPAVPDVQDDPGLKRENRGDRRSLRSSRATVGSGGPRAACAAASRCVCVSGQGRFKGNARAKPRARRARQAEGRAAESLSRADGPGDALVHLGGFGRKRRTRARFTSERACRRAPAKDLGADGCPQRAVLPHRLSRRDPNPAEATFHPPAGTTACQPPRTALSR